MTQKNVGPGEEELRALRADAADLLRAVRATLADLLREAMAGDGRALREVAVKQGELETALKRVFEVEQRYNERSGHDGGEGLDLEAARAEVGRRLARLRAAGGAGGVS